MSKIRVVKEFHNDIDIEFSFVIDSELEKKYITYHLDTLEIKNDSFVTASISHTMPSEMHNKDKNAIFRMVNSSIIEKLKNKEYPESFEIDFDTGQLIEWFLISVYDRSVAQLNDICEEYGNNIISHISNRSKLFEPIENYYFAAHPKEDKIQIYCIELQVIIMTFTFDSQNDVWYSDTPEINGKVFDYNDIAKKILKVINSR